MNASISSLSSIFTSIDSDKLTDDLTDVYLGCAALARILYTLTIVLVQIALWLYDRGCDLYDRFIFFSVGLRRRGDGEPVLALAAATPTVPSMITTGLRSVQARKAIALESPNRVLVTPAPVVMGVADIADAPQEAAKAARKPRAPKATNTTPKQPKAPRAPRKPKAEGTTK
jgi:hypothetical protein